MKRLWDQMRFGERVQKSESGCLLNYGRYVEALDGIRGVAILMILLCHFYLEEAFLALGAIGAVGNKVAIAGTRGVDLFFVLSGFLLTGILLDTKGKAGTYFRNFYARRVLRICPLYYGTLVFIFLVLPLIVIFDDATKNVSQHQWKLWLYLSNIPVESVRWDSSRIFWLSHFWALAVMAQFYLAWPLLAFVLPRRALMGVAFGLLLLGNFARLKTTYWSDLGVGSFWEWSTISRIDGLALGAIIAILVRNHNLHRMILRLSRHGALVSGASFFVIVFVPRRYHPDSVLIIRQIVCVFFFGTMLVLALRKNNRPWFLRLTKSPILIWFGKYSYGLYVIHGVLRPVILAHMSPGRFNYIFRTPILGLPVYLIAVISVCALLAYISWHCYEKHFLRLKKYFVYEIKSI